MQTVLDVSKDQVFKLRLDTEDRQRLDELAAHYSATAATVVRILIKEKHEAMARAVTRQHVAILAEEDPDLFERAQSAYIKRVRTELGAKAPLRLPSRALSTIDLDGLIVLRTTRGAVGRYRFKNDKLTRVVREKDQDVDHDDAG